MAYSGHARYGTRSSYGSLCIIPLEGDKENRYAIRSSYFSRALVEACKSVPGMRFTPETSWYGYADAVEQVRDLLAEKGIAVEGELPEPGSWRDVSIDVDFKGIGNLVARPYQREGVKFIVTKAAEGCLLADAMRLGKSATAALGARSFQEKTVIICPPNAIGVWGREPDHKKPGEIALWWPEAWKGLSKKSQDGVVTLDGVAPAKVQALYEKLSEKSKRTPEESKKLKEADDYLDARVKELEDALVVIVHDQLVYAWVEVLLRWKLRTLIIDEIHSMSSYDARRSIATKKLSLVAVRRIGTSGTPMMNRPRDLHNVVDLLCPGRFGIFFNPNRPEGTYAHTFCSSHQETVGSGPEAKVVWNHNGKSNPEKLHRRLQHMMLRRVAKDVDSQLPEKQRQIVDVRVPANKMIMPTGSQILGDRRALRRCLDLAADGKLKHVLELIKGHTEASEKVVVFCHRKAFAETVSAESKHFGIDDLGATYVHGNVSQKERIARIIKAEEHVGPFVFACTIESCSTAINLSFANIIVFAELTWEPAELAQAEERTYSVGSGRKTLIQYVIARGTGDELILRSIISKLADFEQIVGTLGTEMREDLAGAKKDPEVALKRLALALEELHQAKPSRSTRSRSKGSKKSDA